MLWRVAAALVLFAAGAAAAPTTAPTGPEFFGSAVASYLAGDWPALRKALATPAGQVAQLTPSQQKDWDYIKLAFAECRPRWWDDCRAGRKGQGVARIWGREIPLHFAPAQEFAMNVITRQGGGTVWQLEYEAGKIDSTDILDPKTPQRQFTVGDRADHSLWGLIGLAHTDAAVPAAVEAAAEKKDPRLVPNYRNLRAKFASVCCSSPGGRRLALRWGLYAWIEEAKADGAARKAVGAAFVAMVLEKPENWPSFDLSSLVPEKATEVEVARVLWRRILSQWTLAEDRAAREAFTALAKANELGVLQTGRVSLVGGQSFAFNPAADKPLQQKREAWIRDRLKAIAATKAK